MSPHGTGAVVYATPYGVVVIGNRGRETVVRRHVDGWSTEQLLDAEADFMRGVREVAARVSSGAPGPSSPELPPWKRLSLRQAYERCDQTALVWCEEKWWSVESTEFARRPPLDAATLKLHLAHFWMGGDGKPVREQVIMILHDDGAIRTTAVEHVAHGIKGLRFIPGGHS